MPQTGFDTVSFFRFGTYRYWHCQLGEKPVSRCNYLTSFSQILIPQLSPTRKDPSALRSVSGVLDVVDEQNSTHKVLWKICLSPEEEIEGAMKVSRYYSFTQRPFKAVSGELVYPYFDGLSQFALRMQYIQGGRKDDKLRDLLLTVELRKCEEILRTSLQSFQIHSPREVGRLSRCFGEEWFLLAEERLQQTWSAGISTSGTTVTLSEFLDAPIIVNGRQFPSFLELFQKCEEKLSPSNTPAGFIFGTGDWHGGNILVGNQEGTRGEQDILFIDYEFAGMHQVGLEFVIPYLLDVFYDLFYSHLISEPPNVLARFLEGKVVINTNIGDALGQAIMEIKLHCLLQPLFDFLADQGCDCEAQANLLGCGIFFIVACRNNWPGGEEAFFGRLAVGAMCSQITAVGQLRDSWRLLQSEIS
jgi:hypothetical protein